MQLSDDDELKENKYPAKLIESLREAHRDLRKKDPNFPVGCFEFVNTYITFYYSTHKLIDWRTLAETIILMYLY